MILKILFFNLLDLRDRNTTHDFFFIHTGLRMYRSYLMVWIIDMDGPMCILLGTYKPLCQPYM